MKTIHITKNALWRREGAGIVILEEASGEPYHLDGISAEIFEFLSGGPSFEAIVERQIEEYQGEEETIRDDLEEFLFALLELSLIEVRGGASEESEG